MRSSGGELTVDLLAAEARAAGLDFVAATEHNSALGHADWAPYAGADLLVIPGREVTTVTGHWLALGVEAAVPVDWRYGVRDEAVGGQLDAVRRAGGVCVAAHPHAPYPGGTLAYPYRWFDAVEVWNGLWASDLPWNADNEAALAEWARGLAYDVHRGRWRPAVGNSDAHLAGQLGTPHTVVRADELTADAVLAGLRAGRSWVAGSSVVDLEFTATADGQAAGVGECLVADDAPIVVRLAVRGVPSGLVTLHAERGTVHREGLPADGAGTVEWRTTAQEAGFVRGEVRHPDGRMAALTNPIVLT
ncbi:Predicted metal-dependent phosphoesterase TrpH, contains PHP domain [Micromonospora nigra]|uniref:Predicted metal-dependent phosphoesterase TrpH, contains PHP domain n=1 Tax=Micromonospora nigra TaxID=145857 RepID=A0A1C6T4M2_9ACTN|nr:Predicted metal-dependent phosphoesterase TrpH, contains PHP domain [Micromonospora nigra]